MNNKCNDEKIKDYYRHIENYDWTHAADEFVGLETFFHRARLKKIRSIINKYGKGNYADVGCGTGLITRYLPKNSIGLDINPRNLEKAAKYAPDIKFIEGDIEKLPFPDKNFDTVICTEILEHLLDPLKAIKEIKRILKNGGVLIGSVPSNGILWKLRFLSSTCGTKEPYHKHYSKPEIEQLLGNNFKNIILLNDIIQMNWFFVCSN